MCYIIWYIYETFQIQPTQKLPWFNVKIFCVKLNLEIKFSQDENYFFKVYRTKSTPTLVYTLNMTPYLARLLKSSC